FIEADRGFPDASLSTGPIIVASPMSCIANDVGIPVLLLSSCSSFENALHSGPVSSILSVTTYPQLPQNISPLELSVTIGPFPHLGQRSLKIEISLTKFFHHKNMSHQATSINVLSLYINFYVYQISRQ